MSLLLTLNKFHIVFWCFHCWLWTSKFWMGCFPKQIIFPQRFYVVIVIIIWMSDLSTWLVYEIKYSRMDQVQFVEDNLQKIWSDIVYLSRPYHFKFIKGYFPQVLLSPSLNTLSHISLDNILHKILSFRWDWSVIMCDKKHTIYTLRLSLYIIFY